MNKTALIAVAALAGLVIGFVIADRPAPVAPQAPAAPTAQTPSFAAVPGLVGGQDQTGPYEAVAGWPKPLSQLAGHADWTWGAVQGIYAESPDRVFLLMRGELPDLARPEEVPYPDVGPSLSFPVSATPFRNASVGPITSPGNTGSDGWNEWQGTLGVDARWEHCLIVVDRDGNIIEEWTQWDHLFRRPHSVAINPYDPDKHVWVVDDRQHVVYKFTNDGSELVQTLGVPGEPGDDEGHFNRPTFLAWLPDSTLFVTDGYANTRVVKFDANGNFLLTWGEPGNPPNDTRPGRFNAVHGIAIDPESRRVYVTDRTNRRIQVFDENGEFLHQFSTGNPSTPQYLYMGTDGNLWIADNQTSKIAKFDTEGHYQYSWGSQGQWPGSMWNVHGLSVDQEGNLYIAEVNNGRAQKFVPREGANPELLVGVPLRSAWE